MSATQPGIRGRARPLGRVLHEARSAAIGMGAVLRMLRPHLAARDPSVAAREIDLLARSAHRLEWQLGLARALASPLRRRWVRAPAAIVAGALGPTAPIEHTLDRKARPWCIDPEAFAGAVRALAGWAGAGGGALRARIEAGGARVGLTVRADAPSGRQEASAAGAADEKLALDVARALARSLGGGLGARLGPNGDRIATLRFPVARPGRKRPGGRQR